jgi:DNA (cytosine-5)-methyltransferase 1
MFTPTKFFAVDLFAGCGGLSEGFRQTGIDVIADIEMNHYACKTLITRQLYYQLKSLKKLRLYNKYLRGSLSIEEIFNNNPDIHASISNKVIQATLGQQEMDIILNKIKLSLKYHGGSEVHVLLGGPPCQPYSLIGRARDPDRMENDERHYLYRHYLEILQELKPLFFVYENVPGLFSAKTSGERIFDRLLEDFSALTPPYEIIPPLDSVRNNPRAYILDSADFGVPQHRKRLILIGYKRGLKVTNSTITSIFKRLQEKSRKTKKAGYVSVENAIYDLPRLHAGDGEDGYYGSYPVSVHLSRYQKGLRKFSPGVLNHKARTHMESDLERYKFFIGHQNNGNGDATLKELIEQRPDLIPNHNNLEDFQDRFKVQGWASPSSTITAHISKDGHYYIHPDVNQCRSFTVREAARCQSFPDNYKFEGPRTEQFRQVGNAVPPLLAKAIAKEIRKELEKFYVPEICSSPI